MASITPVTQPTQNSLSGLRKDYFCFIHPRLLTLFKEGNYIQYVAPSGRVISDSFSPRQLGMYNCHKTIPFSNRPIGVFSDSSLRVADLVKGEIIFSVPGQKTDFALSSDDRFALVSSENNIAIDDLRNGKSSLSVPDPANTVALSHCERQVLSARVKGMIKLWDIRKMQEPLAFGGLSDGLVRSLAFSPDDRSALSEHIAFSPIRGTDKLQSEHTINLWNLNDRTSTCLSDYASLYNFALAPLSHFSPDGKWIAFLTKDDQIKLQSSSDSKTSLTFRPGGQVQSMSFSADGKSLLVAANCSGSSGQDIASWQVLDDQSNLLRAPAKTSLFQLEE